MGGLSTTRLLLPFQVPVALWHFLVTDWAPSLDSKTGWQRMLFPVALLPLPVFPTKMILNEEEGSKPWCSVKKKRIFLFYHTSDSFFFFFNFYLLLEQIMSWLKTKIITPVPPFHGKSMGKQWKQWETLFSWAPKALQMVTSAMKLKDVCSLEEKL